MNIIVQLKFKLTKMLQSNMLAIVAWRVFPGCVEYQLTWGLTMQKSQLGVSDVLLWVPAYGQARAGWPARTYIQQLCEDTGFSPADLPEAMNDREKRRERVRDIHASGTTWWWHGFTIILYLKYIMIWLCIFMHREL